MKTKDFKGENMTTTLTFDQVDRKNYFKQNPRNFYRDVK